MKHHYRRALKLNNTIFQYRACVCLFLTFSIFLECIFFFLLFTTFTALHSNKDIFPFLISFFLFLLPMEAAKACANIWACLRTLMQACMRVCAGHQLLTSPPTTSLKNHKKCGEKSVWTQSINIQRWRSDPLVLPLSSIHVFHWVKPAVVWRRTTLWNWVCMTMTTPLLVHLSSFNLSSYPSFLIFHWKKKKAFILLRKMPSLTFKHAQKWANHIHDSQFYRHKHTRSRTGVLLLHKTEILCFFVCLFNSRIQLYWASEWLKMIQESGVI